ncbi:MAG: hypothetical protein FWH15_07530 [Betaproteobacteria bacterium]|nr:hypothetical protein [Betaproteobacteria bacterium]
MSTSYFSGNYDAARDAAAKAIETVKGRYRQYEARRDSVEDRFAAASARLQKDRENMQRVLEELGKFKTSIFANQITYLVDVVHQKLRTTRNSKQYAQENDRHDLGQLGEIERSKRKIEGGLASGAGVVGGLLTSAGAFGLAGAFGTASTGAAISGLSGAAATSSTLAWLGGGAIAIGGFGMTGGVVVLGGIALGSGILITGLARKIKKWWDKPQGAEVELENAILDVEKLRLALAELRVNAQLMCCVLRRLVDKFEETMPSDDSDIEALKQTSSLGKVLYSVLNTPIMRKDGGAVRNLEAALTRKTAGAL